MTDFAFIGKKRSGKTKHAVMVMRQALKDGRRVATNINLSLVTMFGEHSHATYVRVPDYPSAFDLDALGKGLDDGYDEDRFGVLALDELGVWFNARDFADKKRTDTLRWLVHSGEFCWDVYYLLHDVEQADKQLRVSFFEFTVRHTAMRKVKVPFIGWILNALFGGRAGYFPSFHMYSTRLGTSPLGLRTDGGTFVGADVHACYDTQQKFERDYPHGAHSVLSPWHTVGRYKPQPVPWWRQVFARRAASSPRPVTRPDPAYARVLALAKGLPPEEALRLVSRYSRHSLT